MTSRGSLLLTVVVVLGLTIAVVAYDLSRHRATWGDSSRRNPLPLSISGPVSPTPDPEPDFEDDGFAQFALLTESEAVASRPLPTTLPEPAQIEAIPLLSSDQRQENLTAILGVLPDLTADEQEFWLAETAGMSPDMIREMLALRTKFGELTPHDVAPPTISNANSSETESLAASIAQARAMTLQNLANANSVGYRAIEILFVGGPWDADSAAGLEIVGRKLATHDGPLVETGRPLDVALRGPDLLQVRVADELRLTRFGRLQVLADGRLGLDLPAAIPLDPPVKIPDAASEVRISTAGIVECVTTEQPDWHPVGALPLFRVRHPENLSPATSGTYRATAASGPAVDAGDSRSAPLAVGAYEGSNVNWFAEQAKLERLNWLRDELSSSAAQ